MAFTIPKRQFLHQKLDELLRVWEQGSGKGSFILVIEDGRPNFEFCVKLDFGDPFQQQQQQHHGHPRRHRGPARRARDRERAARHQAAEAESAKNFPGEGNIVGNASAPVLNIPLQVEDVFPPIVSISMMSPTTTNTNTVCTTLTPTYSSVVTSLPSMPTVTSTTPILSQGANLVEPTTDVLDHDSDVDEPCGKCGKYFDMRSNPTGCGSCLFVFHAKCKPGHKCVSFSNIL